MNPTFSSLPLTRRAALRLTSGALLSAGLWPGALSARAKSGGKFRFIVINDIHYMTDECGGFLDRVVHQMRYHHGVEFCLLVGDLVEKGFREHLAAVRDIFSSLRLPVYSVPGNHDYLSRDDRSGYDELWPDRCNYTFEQDGWQFIGLDSTQGSAYEKTKIQPATFRWLDNSLPRLDRSRPTVVFTHFPLGDRVRYRPLNADEVLDRFRPFNLRAVFNGHFHGFTERSFQNSLVTTNRCCALKRTNHDKTRDKGYFLCTAEEGGVRREFVQVLFRPQPQPGRRIAS